MKLVKGNLFESGCPVLINTVNEVGIMGKGIALEFKKRFPDIYYQYKARCEKGLVQVGKMDIHESKVNDMRVTIVNFPTKQHWRNPSELVWIIQGLIDLKTYLLSYHEFDDVAMPALGCSNGGLDFNIVRPIIELAFHNTSNRIFLYEPGSK